ncbi:ABC transporter ATP-binding protein/permease [Pasteurella canis]|uniref:ABC superfamily ATP binding cassette transporter, membrane protein n=1 Tax=Pasteurella canis TaxID=753 RepID=A0A379ES86_9PAST|nr:ABC transporter ATP-binding protein/permease [Pasteurella canis]MXN88232.1 ATP-binding cassette domain-containing protein [Pasteurella canis]UAY77844.1 ABC transporter ATP-binding protein/permease [Pasteurella canis]SPY33714.1 ABC superfamily ATP binding cassette transporter, membrane protein [Pasteurella canis]SUC08773.1 ABC superfamily ATP binding cassette transporter, membrane protein [Pasteurella canis]GJJ80213.1 putative ABC transporter ATP-binding protein [Pasteurella canis]
MNWSQELSDSFFWLLKSLSLTAIIFPIAVYIVSKTTRWGHQLWLLAEDYFNPRKNIRPLVYFIVIVFFDLLSVRIDILVSNWYNALYKSLQDMNETVFWQQMVVFAVVATSSIGNALLSYYLSKRFLIHWRLWFNNKMLNKWTENQAYYKTQYLENHLDNPDQRIQQDINSFVTNTLDFATGLISSIVSIVAFTIILWNLSGTMNIGSIEVPHAMVFLVFIYVLFTSIFAFKIGRPLIQLNFANERLNANYRYSLIRLKEYAESIAFYRGEKMEKRLLLSQFDQVIDNVWKVVHRTLKLSGFNLIVTQISVVFPLVIQVTRYFSNQITLGDLMQTSSAFGRVQSALSFFRNSYDDFAAYRAVLDRLTGFHTAIQQVNQPSDLIIQDSENTLRFENLTVHTPTGKTLIQNLNLNLPIGTSLLIQGESGVGKTTLLRTIAGLWSYASGIIHCPQQNTLFLSQKPYLPQGRLIDALYYPDIAPDNMDLQSAVDILQKVQLGHLADKLTLENEWTRVLSLGEQQRLSFARILLCKPTVVFLDEATASMDEGLEDAMYRLLKAELPHTTIISVGHRSTLIEHHQQHLQIN